MPLELSETIPPISIQHSQRCRKEADPAIHHISLAVFHPEKMQAITVFQNEFLMEKD
jgi:hypothetical protein